jgi:hypothetical protein
MSNRPGFKLADLKMGLDSLPKLKIELTEDQGLVLTFEINKAFSSQILEHCRIGGKISFSAGKMETEGTILSIETRNDYSKIILINLTGIV